MANDSFNLFVSSFVSFSINGLKENAENLNYYPILRRKVELYLFLRQLTVNEKVFFVASSKCCQQWLRSRWAFFISNVLCLVNLMARTCLVSVLTGCSFSGTQFSRGHRLILFKWCLKQEIGSQVYKKDLGTSFLYRLKTALKSRKTIKGTV